MQDISVPESDAVMIKNRSALPGAEPLASGPDLLDLKTSPLVARISELASDWSERGAGLYRRAEAKTRENPWIAVAAAAAGALAVGFIVGRRLSRKSALPSEEYPSGYSE